MARAKLPKDAKRSHGIMVYFSPLEFLRLERARIQLPAPIPTRSTLAYEIIRTWLEQQERK
jgi:hypothetical protein